MAIEDYVPEDKRADFIKELQSTYIPATGLEKHPEFQRQLSIKHETTMANFQKDKLPELIESEIKKRTTKDPATMEIEKLRAEIAEERRQGVLKERKSQAIADLSKVGLNPDLADFILHEDEAKFKENIAKLTGHVVAWRDEEVKKIKVQAYGQNPKAGDQKEVPKMSLETFNSLPLADRQAFAKAGGIFE